MDPLSLSSIQEQYVVNSRLFEGTAVYNIAGLTRMEGTLDGVRLRSAWERVWRGTDVFRFQGGVAEGEAGWVTAAGPAPWREVQAAETEVAALAQDEAERPFDLTAPGPLARVTVYRVSPTVAFVLVVQHHSVTDLFSKNLLAHNLAQAYRDPAFVVETLPYARFIEAEKAWLATPAGQKARDYWHQKLTGGYETLKLPGASWTPGPFAATGARVGWTARAAHTAALEGVEAGGRSPFLVLLTAWAALLSRLSGQRKFLVGVPLTNRLAFGDQPLAGPCVNILPVGVEVAPEMTLEELYTVVRGQMLGNHRHQGFPFLEMVRMLPGGDRDPLRPRVLQAGFTNEPPMRLELEGLGCRPVPLERSGAQMDLFFTWWKGEAGWEGYWEYNQASFGEAEVRLWQEGFERLLEAVLERPGTEVGEVRLIGADREKALAEGPVVAYPLEKSLSWHLRQSYRKNADQTALVWRGEATDYRRFEAGVAKVASHLYGAYGAKGRVAVLLERSPLMLYALHGTAQSGNAYVPMGIDWPVTRIEDILADIEPWAVLTEAKYRDKVAGAKCPVLLVEDLLAGPEVGLPAVDPAPSDALYILYTSGTTGRPKGAELPHDGIVNHVFWMQDRYGLVSGERCLLKTPYTFDVSVWELFWPLTFGATLVLSDEAHHKDPREILDLAVAERVNRLDFVPSLLELFVDQDGLERLVDLHHVHAIGEALSVGLLKRFLAKLPWVKLHNLYGPTEASVSVTHWELGQADVDRGTVPIGLPMANTQLYILDAKGQPCPPLVRGEILLGGVCLAKGYWKRPDLTADKFVPNPFGPGRLYKTGDWGRYGLDGAVEYLERQDTQTKIRGVRVELGEIESFMRRIEAVENAVVKKGKGPGDQECLLAYYTVKTGQQTDGSQIRKDLRQHLPDALIPDAFIRLEGFPTNDNGKLDRKALSDRLVVETPAFQGGQAHELEGTEAQVARLWEGVLGHPCQDNQQNFFDAGGNSINLLALRKVLEGQFGRPVKVAELFQRPTVSGMASLFAQGEDAPGAGAEETGTAERADRRRQSMQNLARRHKDVR